MSNNKSLQILRGTDSKTTNLTLLPGQPFYNKTTKQLLIGSGTGTNESTLADSGIRVEKADQLTTARTISLGTGATGTATSFDGTQNVTIPVTNVKEAYLTWGGQSLSGKISPVDNAMSNTHSANRLAFAKPQGMVVEYSRDGGLSWTEALNIDFVKTRLMSGIGDSCYIGGVQTGTTVNDKLRITLDAHDLGIYVYAVKLLLDVSTNGATGSHVVVETSTIGAPTTFTSYGDYPLSGWSGWNSIPLTFAFGGSSNQTDQTKKIRLTFGITGISSGTGNFALYNLQLYSSTYWGTNSSMAKTGHLYDYDQHQNAVFPAQITASDFTTSTSFSINNKDYGTPSLNELHKIVNTKTESIETIIANKTVSFHLDTSELNTGLYVSDEGVITSAQWPISNYSKYLITWDGVEYEVWEDLFTRTKWDPTTGFPTTWYDWYCMGNGEKLGAYHPETKDIPFAITRDLLTNKADIYIWATNGSTASTHTITVKKVTNHQVRKLNREYIYNYNNFLYQGKQANSGWIGLNVVDGPSAFAVGDGNYIERDPSVSGTQNQGSFVSGGGNKLLDSSHSQVGGIYNILTHSTRTSIQGFKNKVNAQAGAIISGSENTVDFQMYPDPKFLGGNSLVIGIRNTLINNGGDFVSGQGNSLTGDCKPSSDSSLVAVQGNGIIGYGHIGHHLQTSFISGRQNTVRQAEGAAGPAGGHFVGGMFHTITGANYAFVGGYKHTVTHAGVLAAGYQHTSDRKGQAMLGTWSAPNPDAILKVGNGADASGPSNAFVVLNDGRAQVQTAPVETIDVVRKQELDGKEDIISWTAQVQNSTWSRICLITTNNGPASSGMSGILHVQFLRGNVVGNATFIVNASHSKEVYFTQVNATDYTSFKIRGVTDSYANNTYIEIYDDARSDEWQTQRVDCKFLPLSNLSITKYTSFTSGAEVPNDYTAGAVLTVDISGGSMVASKFVGTATNAEKLKTPRNISLGKDLTGNAYFDGSGDITISAKHYNASVKSSNTYNYPWHRFAKRGSKASPITISWNDGDAIFCVRQTYADGGYGIIKISLRTNNVNTKELSKAKATWLVRHNLALEDVKIGLYNVAGATYADLFVYAATYARMEITQLEGNRDWTMMSSSEVQDTTTTDAKTSVECYKTIEDAATKLHGQAYSSIIAAVDGGQVNLANKAVQDGNGNNIVNTYVTLATAQTISGVKTFSASSGFNYSGIENGISDASRHVWFSHLTNKGTPVYNDNFKYNPSGNKFMVGTSTATTAQIDLAGCTVKYTSSTKSISFNFV